MTEATVRDFHREAFEAGKVNGAAYKAMGKLITDAREVGGFNEETISDLRDDCAAGDMVRKMGWSEKAAREWLADKTQKKRVEKGETPTNAQRAYGAFRVSWSAALAYGGLAKQTNKGGRPKGSVAPSPAAETQDGQTQKWAVGAVADIDDVLLRLMSIDEYLQKLGKAAARIVGNSGDTGMVIRDLIARIHKDVTILTGAADLEDKIAA